jgi:hypothetical protein
MFKRQGTMQRLRMIAVLALVLGASLPAPLGATPNEDADKQTGADTPQSQALAKELQGILDQRVKIQAQMRELINKRQPITELSKQMSEMVRAAYKKADELADARAKGAVDQRCVKPPETQQSTAAASGASSFVCPQVLAGGASGGNDPWLVCACTRRYLIGAKKELDDLRRNFEPLIGRALPDSTNTVGYPLTAEELHSRLRNKEIIDPDELPEKTMLPMVQRVQRELARDRVQASLSDKQPRPRDLADLFNDPEGLASTRAYGQLAVQNAIALVWTVQMQAALLQSLLLQQSIDVRLGEERMRSGAEEDPLLKDHVTDDAPFMAIAARYDRKAWPFIQSKAQELRALVAELKETRLRLLRDATLWKDFSAGDGSMGVSIGYGDPSFANFIVRRFMGDWGLGVYFVSWRGNWVGPTSYMQNREWMYLLPGANPDDYPASVTRALQQFLPEARVNDSGGLVLSHRVTTNERETLQATASGANEGQSP